MENSKNKKLWRKDVTPDEKIEQFTVGQDRELDMHLAEFDVLGSLAHIQMLESIGLLSKEELEELKSGLIEIYHEIKQNKFKIEEGVEDIHSQVELLLTQRLGSVGKKIHAGRSRNDQVLLDIRLYVRDFLKQLLNELSQLFKKLLALSEEHKDVLLPGYTHMQAAMPSSFGLWFAAYAESLVDDVLQLQSAYKIVNKNPLGSAAGFGSSFPLDRKLTTDLLGFDDLNYNSVYAQMGRSRTERVVSSSMASLAETAGKMATDIILYMSQNFGFVSFPDFITTGSSIMPHKKNPDIFEILRAKCSKIKALPNTIMMVNTNLTSGYHRDFQLIKEMFIPSLFEIRECIQMLNYVLEHIQINKEIFADDKYDLLFTVEAVNQLVADGMPFREAYLKISDETAKGLFKKPKSMKYTHEGSIGNLCNERIQQLMESITAEFNFEKIENAYRKLLES